MVPLRAMQPDAALSSVSVALLPSVGLWGLSVPLLQVWVCHQWHDVGLKHHVLGQPKEPAVRDHHHSHPSSAVPFIVNKWCDHLVLVRVCNLVCMGGVEGTTWVFYAPHSCLKC